MLFRSREFCDPQLTTQQLADTLTMAGLEVEETRPVAPAFTRIVVAEIKEAVQHPNADRLRVCQVDAGQGALLNIVCGAPNARAGIKVPWALVGAELPPGEDGKPFVIKLGKLRGVESQGMLCSARELQLSDDHGGLLELSADAPIGQDIRQHLELDDTLFTLKLTPNLAHCLSVYGIARELSALTGAALKTPTIASVTASSEQRLNVDVQAKDLCGRFSGRVVQGVNPQAATPAWMVERLARCGQRSVSPLVDISNYVMFELGRPSHIFDLDKIHGPLQVRWGSPGASACASTRRPASSCGRGRAGAATAGSSRRRRSEETMSRVGLQRRRYACEDLVDPIHKFYRRSCPASTSHNVRRNQSHQYDGLAPRADHDAG